MSLTISAMAAADWPEVRQVYQEGIDTGHATFETTAPATWEEFSRARLPVGCLIARDESGRLAGWIALSPVSARRVYAGVAEVSVYVAATRRGAGVGDRLLRELIEVADAAGIWTLQSSTFPENAASIALQVKHGFRPVGTRERIARMSRGPFAGRWRDTVLLERRSPVAGGE
jgi:L-amino acid N-acyltransferase YncA